MDNKLSIERRRHVRCILLTKFKGAELSQAGVPDASRQTFCGDIQNFSEGGLSLLTNCKVNQFGVIHGAVMIPGVAQGVPSLWRVLWVKPAAKEFLYHVGLQFLI